MLLYGTEVYVIHNNKIKKGKVIGGVKASTYLYNNITYEQTSYTLDIKDAPESYTKESCGLFYDISNNLILPDYQVYLTEEDAKNAFT